MHLKPYERVKTDTPQIYVSLTQILVLVVKMYLKDLIKYFLRVKNQPYTILVGLDLRGTPDVISYNFINAFPIAIQDIPLSYGNGQILQVQVDFSYDRYYVVQTNDLDTMGEIPLGTVLQRTLEVNPLNNNE